jgi:hypothetical protein
MFLQSENRTIIFALTALTALGICAATICFAGEAKEQDAPAAQTTPQIKEIPAVGLEGDRNFAGEVERLYDFIGTIDEVGDEGIVVDDTYFKKAAGAKMSGVRQGARVGLMLNQQGEMVVCEPYKKVQR